MQAATFPGTVTPLRGLTWFGESERDVLFGRDREREALARLVVSDGFRAGLLYGEQGVGKTSLLRAGLVPYLRDHGVVAVVCEDPRRPVASFAAALAQMTSRPPASGEAAVTYLARVVSEAMSGQQYLFILDDADAAMTGDEAVVAELGDLFAKVVSRSGGRARFLFACASDRAHQLGALERRTGSLFPPQNRFELERFTAEVAAEVIDRTLALAGLALERDMPRTLAQGAGSGGPVLPADLQLLALAARELGVTTPAQLTKMGGASELEMAWLRKVSGEAGDERAVLRILAELAQPNVPPVPVEWVAARAGVEPQAAHVALARLVDKGVTRATAVPGSAELHFALAHEILSRRVREAAAPARAAARRAHELIGAKVASKKRLTAAELYAIRREGLAPATPDERAIIQGSLRFYKIIAAAAGGGALFLVILLYVVQAGRYYLDTDGNRVVVRAGRSGLSAFHWLPFSGYGDVVADPGLSRAMVEPRLWDAIADHDLGGTRASGDLVAHWLGALRPGHRAVVEYAASGKEAALEPIKAFLKQPAELAEALVRLQPVARGLPGEVALIDQAMTDPSPVVQAAALGVAASAASRVVGAYRTTLAAALASADPEQRRLALSAVRRLPAETAQGLYHDALAAGPDPSGRRELVTLVAGSPGTGAPSADSAASVLRNRSNPEATRDKARGLLRRAFAATPGPAALAAARLAADGEVGPEDRSFALGLVYELAPKEAFGDLVEPIKSLLSGRDEAMRAAALPVYARVNPEAAAGDLAIMLQDASLSPALKEAMALAWGEVARGKDRAAAVGALETLVKSENARVRAAAARAFGFAGRPAQATLVKLIKIDRFDVALGAAAGLANSIEVGAPSGEAVFGIAQLWKRKGKARREAAEIFARIARFKPSAVDAYLGGAARSTEDPALHPIGVRGLCNAMVAGDKSAAREIARSVEGAAVEVRRAAIECVADNPRFLAQTVRIALLLAGDADGDVRREAAGVLAELATAGKPGKEIGDTLVQLAKDDSRDVRVLGVQALALLGASAPKAAVDALPRAFDRGDETERLVVLDAATKLGAGELVQLAVADASPLVRIAALDTAVATGTAVAATVSAALTDPDATVRRAALGRLARGGHGLSAEQVDRALGLATGDVDPAIATIALTAMARLGDPIQVVERLRRLGASPSEAERVKATTATAGLAEIDAKKAIALLEPALAERSHDVRVALVPALATAYARGKPPAELGALLRDSEDSATRRLAAAAALALLAGAEGGDAAKAELARTGESGPPLGKLTAQIAFGLLEARADVVAFLASLAP